ncbi:MAG: LEPR-XLL domain-containing protein, partial [Planctomycetes bacterium]|nr:LEPR-XLL domain-containing protein [Planctomycetota bacterium]
MARSDWFTHRRSLTSRRQARKRKSAHRAPQWKTRGLQLESLEDRLLLSANVATDQADYAPGATAHIFASDFAIGEAVQFQVLHNDGTPNTGNGHLPWTVVDGSADDLDGLVNGDVHTTWYVDPDDSADSSFDLTALGLTSGWSATTTFTDDGGDFSLDFVAADPFSYDHSTGGGAYDDRTIGTDVVESLEGGDFTCDDIVTYLVQITVDDMPTDPTQVIDIDFTFTSDTTGQSGAGHYDIVGTQINYGVIAGGAGEGPGGTDSGIMDDGGSVATLISETLPSNPFMNGTTDLMGTIRITDLEAGEKVVLRIDVRVGCDPTASPTGNLQASVDSASVVSPTPDTINVGNQTIPFMNLGELIRPATKSGTKFHDHDADGVQDQGDEGIAGFEIRAYADTDGDGILNQAEFDAGFVASDTTDANGDYSLTLDPGDYIVVEVQQAGYFQSAPATDVVTANTGNTLGELGYAIVLTSGQEDANNDFGNFQNATKSGMKFHDHNANGVKDAGDEGL